jgi:hypothetical protein
MNATTPLRERPRTGLVTFEHYELIERYAHTVGETQLAQSHARDSRTGARNQ